MLKIFDSYIVFYFDKSDTNRILFDQNCHRQIPGVDVYCFGVSNDICMLCASMNVYQVFKGRPISIPLIGRPLNTWYTFYVLQ